jgi:hypothetical protein
VAEDWISASLGNAYPDAGRFVATIPSAWFQITAINTEAMALTNVVGTAYPNTRELVAAAARTTSWPNSSNLVVHEIGHSYGLGLTCEDYTANFDCVPDRYGIIAPRGLRVNERIPIQIPIKHEVFCLWAPVPVLNIGQTPLIFQAAQRAPYNRCALRK